MTDMEEMLDRIDRAERQLAELRARGEPAQVARRLRRRIGSSVFGAVVLSLIAFVALLPVGAALAMVARLLVRLGAS